MSDILSQQEIDDLLLKLSGSGATSESNEMQGDAPTYKVHDFKTANKFSKEQMRTLHIIFENFAYLLSTRMTGMLRTVCDVKVTSIEELIFSEFNNAITTSAILSVIDAPPLRGSLLLELAMPVAYAFIIRMLGGIAEYTNTSKKFTEIEFAIIRTILERIMQVFTESFKKVIEINPTLQQIETSSQFTQICAMNEPAAIVTLNVKIDQVEEMMVFCIPHYTLQPIAKRLNTMTWNFAEMSREQHEPKTDLIGQRLKNATVTLSTFFNDLTVPLDDILWLKPGDVLCLNHAVDDYVTVKVEHIPKFKGVMGVVKNHQVVQIADVIKENGKVE